MSEEDEEFQEFLEIFQEESLERLRNCSRALDAIQAEEGEPSEHLDEVDRELHTIKGSARLLGFSELATLVHELEGLARAYRETPALGLELLIEASDRLSALVEQAAESGEDVTDLELQERAKAAAQGPAPEPEPLLTNVPASEPPVLLEESLPAPTPPRSAPRPLEPPPAPAQSTPPSQPRLLDSDALPRPDEGLPTQPASGRPETPTTSSTRTRVRARGETQSVDRRGGAPRPEDEIVRVRASRLGELDEIVSDLTLARQRLDTYEKRLSTLLNAVAEGAADARDVTESLQRVVQDFRGDLLRVRNSTGGLQHLAVDVRLRPVSALFDRVPRQVRELTRQLDRQVGVTLSGEDTEMDRVILDSLKSPLSHLLRNAIDHGLESPAERVLAGKPAAGTLSLRAGQEGNRIVIQVSDDGRGIDPDKVRRLAVERGVLDGGAAEELSDEEVVQLIFASGFSTKEGVTQISGRGVGMDAVRRAVEELKGDVLVTSQVGQGTTITIRLPLTLLISRVMLMRSAGQRFALPTESVEESVRVNSFELIQLSERPALEWRGQTLRILHLTEFLGQPILPDPEFLRVLIVRHGKDRLALVVEELLEERSVVVKPLGWPLDELAWLSGAVQDPSGEIALQLHVPRLFERSATAGRRARRRRQSRSVLVVDDSLVSRQKLGRSLEALGFDPIVAVDGMDALGLLERIRPLLILTDIEMPRLDGFALVRRVRARPKLAGVPVVIVSNRGSEQDREAGLQAGADAYLSKSEFSTASLRETIERLL